MNGKHIHLSSTLTKAWWETTRSSFLRRQLRGIIRDLTDLKWVEWTYGWKM